MTIISRFYITICWAGSTFILIAWPINTYIGTKVTYYDKVFHLFLFGIFSWLVAYTLIYFKNIKLAVAVIISLLSGVMYSALAECLQGVIDGRTVSQYDFIAGLSGSFIFSLIFYVKYRKPT